MSKDERPLNDEEILGFRDEIEWAIEHGDVEYGLHELDYFIREYKRLRDMLDEPDAWLLKDGDGYVLGAYRNKGEAMNERDKEIDPDSHEIVPLYTRG